ncbi:MAG TPA: hypothetical protein VHM70_12230 [Polyangiaceae bacterium]|nr:hypothetical protein [Polyangiaceae bacterium]
MKSSWRLACRLAPVALAVLVDGCGSASEGSPKTTGSTVGQPQPMTSTIPVVMPVLAGPDPAPATTDGTVTPGPAVGEVNPDPAGTGAVATDPGNDILIDEGDTTTGPKGGFLPSEKVDMLFVVDNSSSMGDKQAVFRDAVPDMIDQMVNPPCVAKDENEKQVFVDKQADGTCPTGARPIFKPVTDIHIGVVSSSLGPRGLKPEEAPSGFNCNDVAGENDKAWMIGRARPELNADTYQGYGFLVWDQGQKAMPPGDGDLAVLLQKFDTEIATVGEAGCGFESPLEAAYRFLVDPDPYKDIVRGPCAGQTEGTLCGVPDGVDQDLLDQRTAFLRPDSVVVVMYLTDENDCSLKSKGQGYLAMATGQLDNGTAICETDPNNQCCLPCGATPKPEWNCPTDPTMNGCDRDPNDILEATPIRCFDQQQRFGVSLLRSTDVYVGGFVFPNVPDRAGMAQPNPLFTDKRGREKIFVVGIIGVPWQDTATDDTRGAIDKGQFDLVESSSVDWSKYLTINGAPPGDPFNFEAMAARTGTQPYTMEPMGPAGTWNSVNGHERNLLPNDGQDDDLQYSCIFPLPAPRDCTAAGDSYCDCAPADPEMNLPGPEGNPLCWDATTQTYTTNQVYAKAYPAPRMLELLHGVACPPIPNSDPKMNEACTDQAVVSSICPRQVTDKKKLDYGYRPVIRALLLNVSDRLVR